MVRMGDEVVKSSTGLEHIGQTLTAYRTVLADVTRQSAFGAMERIGEYTRDEERVITFVQALRRPLGGFRVPRVSAPGHKGSASRGCR